jgi:phage shock protein PspC (stress-responsive transcriptional regulator)
LIKNKNIKIMAKLTRSNNKLIAGVCGGLAEHFGLNASAMRIVFILLLFLTFSAAGIAYLILWAIMPTKNAGDNYKERMQNRLNN